MAQEQGETQIITSGLKCPSCAGIFSPPLKRLLLKGLVCPYCGQKQAVDQLTGLNISEGSLDGLEQASRPPVFELDKNAEPWRVDGVWLYGGLFAIGQVVVMVGMMLSGMLLGSEHKDLAVNTLVVVGTACFMLAFLARLLPEKWMSRMFTRIPRLTIDSQSLRLRTRSGRLRIPLEQVQLVTPLSIYKLDKTTRTMLLGGADYVPSKIFRGSAHTLVLHLDSGLTLALPLLLSQELCGQLSEQINGFLVQHQDPTAETDGQANPVANGFEPKKHPRIRAGFLSDRIELPPEEPDQEVYCPNCGARAELPPQIQLGDSVSCTYCDGLLVLRRLQDSVLLKRIRLATGTSLWGHKGGLHMSQERQGFRSLPVADSRGILSVWALFAVAFGILPVALVIQQAWYIVLPVAGSHLFPLFYLYRSTRVRGDRSDRWLTVSKIAAAIGSAGLWLLPVLIYRNLGRLNPYRLRIIDGHLGEGFRFGSKRRLKMDRIKRAEVFQWDRLEAVADPETYVERVRQISKEKEALLRTIYGDDKLELRAIWGLALELKDGQVYLSQLLSDRSNAELLALHINRLT